MNVASTSSVGFPTNRLIAPVAGLLAFFAVGAYSGAESAVLALLLVSYLFRSAMTGSLETALAISTAYGAAQILAHYGVIAFGFEGYLHNEASTRAATLGLCSYLVYWAVLMAATGSLRRHAQRARMHVETMRVHRTRVLVVYAVLLSFEVLFANALGRAALGQVVRGVLGSRMIILMAMPVLARSLTSRPRILIAALMAVEVLLSLGYFSSFKFPILVLFVGYAAFSRDNGLGRLGVIIGGILVVASFWTVVKSSVRYELSGGAGQVNLRSRVETVEIVGDHLKDVGVADLGSGVEGLVRRLAYVDMLGLVLLRFPLRQQHLGGELFLSSLGNVFRPRFLFPDKGVYDDSELTRRIATENVAGSESGTSVSVGWVGESFADLGYTGVLMAAFLLASMMGMCLNLIRRFVGASPLWVLGAALFSLKGLPLMEDSLLKKPASLVLSFIGLILGVMFLSRCLVSQGNEGVHSR